MPPGLPSLPAHQIMKGRLPARRSAKNCVHDRTGLGSSKPENRLRGNPKFSTDLSAISSVRSGALLLQPVSYMQILVLAAAVGERTLACTSLGRGQKQKSGPTPIRARPSSESGHQSRSPSRLLWANCGRGLFNHLVGAREQRRRHVETKPFCGFEVDHQLILGRCLHR